MQSLFVSRYTILTTLYHGRCLAYNSLSGSTALLEKNDFETFNDIASGRLVDPQDPIVANLLYGGFVTTYENEVEVLKSEYDAQRYDGSGMVLTIAPTLACNFGCDYCFQGKDKPAESMSQDVQNATMSLVRSAAPGIKRLHVAWYGGEPLLKLKIIENLSDRFIAECDKRNISYDAMIVTNGYKLNADVARSLWVRRVKTAQVTLDGAAQDHDSRRALLGGQETFKRITDNLRSVVDESPLGISVRVNIDSRNKERISDLLDQLANMGFARRPNFSVYFAPVEAITEGCHSVAGVCMSKTEYGQLETDLTRHAYGLGLMRLPYPRRSTGVCGALKPKGLVIVPNGDIHKCWDTVSMPRHRVGSVFYPFELNTDERVLKWMRWTPFNNDTCKECKLLPTCAGSCAHKFINAEQTAGEAASLPCPSWKYNIKERLLLLAEKSGMISAGDWDPAQAKTDPREICAVPGHLFDSDPLVISLL